MGSVQVMCLQAGITVVDCLTAGLFTTTKTIMPGVEESNIGGSVEGVFGIQCDVA